MLKLKRQMYGSHLLQMSCSDADSMQEMVENDARFLRDHGIMDYSLFLTIEKVSSEEHAFMAFKPSTMVDEAFKKEYEDEDLTSFGSIVSESSQFEYRNRIVSKSADGEKRHLVYHVGIIDYLQEWDWSKKTEVVAK